VIYTSAPDYAGKDRFLVQGIGPAGRLLSQQFSVTVLPQSAMVKAAPLDERASADVAGGSQQ
jgi:hypothetical protein